MRRIALLALVALGLAPSAEARGVPGQFDYYVLSLSWSAGWCALTGDARRDPQCAAGRGLNFTLHGLWPQNRVGYPADCTSAMRPPSRAETAAMADITGSAGLAWHEWKKHGTCSGLSPRAYFSAARQAYDSVKIPEALRDLKRPIRVKPDVVVEAFLEANPRLKRSDIAVTCDSGRMQEVRICLTKALAPRPCSAEAAQSCRLPAVQLDPVR
ncbi:MAG: ribonuclease T2 [Paracoccaceae bacterium]|nr:ribonuclease T2 [Paracoccaceae bacterium]MDE3238517.1 ribonuclease T2 [Paracoccaceae bacterium]